MWKLIATIFKGLFQKKEDYLPGVEKIFPKEEKIMRKTVVIDPGHGGGDPGAVNKELNYLEKDIVLKVAKYLAAELKENYSYIVPFLSRENDESISLDHRCIKANRVVQSNLSVKPADIFLSIHTNARALKGKYGLEIETYYYKDSEIGKELAKIIQKNLVSKQNMLPTIDRGVKAGKRWSKKKQKWMSFYVLKHTEMPAVLVELGFLSDVEECIILASSVHQQTMAKVLAQSIAEFFEKENA